MIEVGRVCVKIAGRDAGRKCVVVDVLDNTFVMIDGETRRRKCNVMHLEALDKSVDIKKGASHADVSKAVSALGWKVLETKKKASKPRPRKARRSKLATAPVAEAKPAAKTAEISNRVRESPNKLGEKPKTEAAKPVETPKPAVTTPAPKKTAEKPAEKKKE